MSKIVYTIPDFVDEDGCVFSEIEFIVEVTDSDDIRETAKLADCIQKSLSPMTFLAESK